ncbi:MAG: ferrous iron transport protein A [Leptolyngbyaceae cyanobacterium]
MDYRPRQQRRSWFTFLGGSLEQPDSGEAMADDQTLSQPATSFLLSQANVGDLVWIVGFTAGPEGRQRLISMGLNRGTELEVVNRTAGGSIMVAVANTRLGLGLDIADKIYVRQSVIQTMSNPLHSPADLKISSSPSLTQEKPMQTRLRDLAVGIRDALWGMTRALVAIARSSWPWG